MITKTACNFIKSAFASANAMPGVQEANAAMWKKMQFTNGVNNTFTNIQQANKDNALGTVAGVGQKLFNVGNNFINSGAWHT